MVPNPFLRMTLRFSGKLAIVLLCAATVPAAQGAAAPVPPPLAAAPVPDSATASAAPPPAAEQELAEVVVRGTRLWQLRAAIIEAEDRFYARYNELNGNDDFDVHCRQEAPLGTRLKRRVCRVAFQEDAEADFAQGLFTGSFAPEPQLVMLERSDEYRANALAVINSDRRLRALVRERERLEEKYNEERRKRFKDRWIIFE